MCPIFSPTRLLARQDAAPRDAVVGLVLRGGSWDSQRSIPPRLLAPLRRIPGVTLCPLQLDSEPAAPFARLASPRVDSIDALASAVAAVDLFITIDSLPAHLGGALSVPTWTLLPAEADWRWMEDREDTPWYPTMRLFRQPRAGDWPAVIAAVGQALRRRVKRRPRGPRGGAPCGKSDLRTA